MKTDSISLLNEMKSMVHHSNGCAVNDPGDYTSGCNCGAKKKWADIDEAIANLSPPSPAGVSTDAKEALSLLGEVNTIFYEMIRVGCAHNEQTEATHHSYYIGNITDRIASLLRKLSA